MTSLDVRVRVLVPGLEGPVGSPVRAAHRAAHRSEAQARSRTTIGISRSVRDWYSS
jgi:hypothetical protein